jgi:hypothetical protein
VKKLTEADMLVVDEALKLQSVGMGATSPEFNFKLYAIQCEIERLESKIKKWNSKIIIAHDKLAALRRQL